MKKRSITDVMTINTEAEDVIYNMEEHNKLVDIAKYCLDTMVEVIDRIGTDEDREKIMDTLEKLFKELTAKGIEVCCMARAFGMNVTTDMSLGYVLFSEDVEKEEIGKRYHTFEWALGVEEK